MSECGPDCGCGSNQKSNQNADREVQHGCIVTFKSGNKIQVDISATRVKHMRRTGGVLTVMSPSGVKLMVSAKAIVDIQSLAPTESVGVE